jgi:hypothetical protein
VTLPDTTPVAAPLSFTLTKLKSNLPLKVLAMPPFDGLVAGALQGTVAGASVSVTPWPVEGFDRPGLMKDASHRVRAMAPDLVIIAVPRKAAAKDREEFIRTQMWIASNSLSRGKREWDVAVVHPDVFEGPGNGADEENDTLIRAIVPAQDLPLLDRTAGDGREAGELLEEWIEREFRE